MSSAVNQLFTCNLVTCLSPCDVEVCLIVAIKRDFCPDVRLKTVVCFLSWCRDLFKCVI